MPSDVKEAPGIYTGIKNCRIGGSKHDYGGMFTEPLVAGGFKHLFDVHPYLRKSSNLANVLQKGLQPPTREASDSSAIQVGGFTS